ncbi:hypothetical protein [Chamaesiphon sp. OTE_75_metabat_556]|uniref:hypothetical protein n=1 Tax=Chamaesiphon sp. OTE_75_metabat_556 TaxID=2964692 RepID=UPI00286BB655|nr:hypothetical protein [Chamaesiphon sp. OTE_75_metabat_556]
MTIRDRDSGCCILDDLDRILQPDRCDGAEISAPTEAGTRSLPSQTRQHWEPIDLFTH